MGCAETILVMTSGDGVTIARTMWSGTEIHRGEDSAAVIQKACDLLDGGGEIRIEPGVYRLEQPISPKSGTSVTGAGRGTKILCVANGLSLESVDGVSISNLTLIGKESADTGIKMNSVGDSQIQNCYIIGFKNYGIHVTGSSFLCDIHSCQLAGNGKANILMEDLNRGRVGDFMPMSISDCMIYGGGHGIEFSKSTVMNVVGCTVFETTGAGFFIHDNSNSVLISGCRTFQITGNAVRAEQSNELNVSSSIFCWHTEEGIVVKDCYWGVISANEVIDSGSYNPDAPDQTVKFSDVWDGPGSIPAWDGIRLDGAKGFNVSANTIFNWPQGTRMNRGIYENADCSGNTIASNNINYCKTGVVAEGAESTRVGNTTVAVEPHHTGTDSYFPSIQSFQLQRIKQYIDDQMHLTEL